MITIQIWSDVSCPFCYIGKRTLERAIQKLGVENNTTVEFKSFELDPFIPKDFEGNVYEYLGKKYGRSYDEARAMTQAVAQRAKEVGLVFDFDIAKHARTFDAHRLLHLAKQEGLQAVTKELLMKSYFEKGLNVAKQETLVHVGAAAGLPEERIRKILTSQEFTAEVANDIEEARKMRVNGVPFFLFDGQYAVSGAQPENVFIDVLTTLLSQSPTSRRDHEGPACNGETNC